VRHFVGLLSLILLIGCGGKSSFRLAELQRTDEDGNPQQTIVYHYDDANHLIGEDHLGATGKLIQKITYELNEHGVVEKMTTTNNSGSVIEYEMYGLSDDGLRKTLTRKTGLDSLLHYVEYEYDENGHVSKETHYDRKMLLSEIVERHADRKGNLTRCQYFGLDGVFLGSEQNELDGNGNMLLSHRYDTEGMEIQTISNEYDKLHRLKNSYDAVDNQVTQKHYHYNRFGLLNRVTTSDDDGEVKWIENYKYELISR
jgi:hypothetical protein